MVCEEFCLGLAEIESWGLTDPKKAGPWYGAEVVMANLTAEEILVVKWAICWSVWSEDWEQVLPNRSDFAERGCVLNVVEARWLSYRLLELFILIYLLDSSLRQEHFVEYISASF